MLDIPATRIELSAKNLAHNLDQFKRILTGKVRLGVVLKANAYGHGLLEMVALCKELSEFIILYDWHELETARRIYDGEILMIGPIGPMHLVEAIYLSPTFGVFSVPYMLQLEELGRSLKRQISIHLAIDADFGREGLLASELPLAIENLRKSKFLHLKGVFAHLSSAGDDRAMDISEHQLASFFQTVEVLASAGFRDLTTHVHASSGTLLYKGLVRSRQAVRIGLSLYGLWPSPLLRTQNPEITLRPILRWVSWISQIKTVSKGTPIGYSQTYTTENTTTLALIPQGYGHGYPRGASNRAEVLIQGKRCKVVGLVSMNCMMVDISHLKNPKIGEEVVLLGTQGSYQISAEELAQCKNSINYEVLTSISPLLPRVIT
jgi:alanine racemase